MDDELFSMLLFFLFYMVAPVVGIIVLVVVLSKGKKKTSPGAPQQEKDAVSTKAPEPVQEEKEPEDDLSIARRVLENTLLFDADFAKTQNERLDGIQSSVSTHSGNFHEMPEENLKVAVVGAFSCGKSAFINSILEDKVAPSEITPMTHGITSFIYGEKEIYKADDELVTREEYQSKVQDKSEKVKHFIIEYPCPRLKDFEFMDSPGFGSVSDNDNKTAQEDTELSEEAVQCADVVFFLNCITEGIIKGDAMERLKEISRNDKAKNPHRRIFVVLTWADKKGPSARETIRNSIINLCEENKLNVDGVMLYSSLPERAKASDKDFFIAAKAHLFETLIRLRAEGQELKKFRMELKQHAESHARQKAFEQFVKDCRLVLKFQPDIQKRAEEKKFDKQWTGFAERCAAKIADITYNKIERILLDPIEVQRVFYEEKLSDHFLSGYRIVFNYTRLFLTDAESMKIAEAIRNQNIVDGKGAATPNKGLFIFPENKASFNRFFRPTNSESVSCISLQKKVCEEIFLPMKPLETFKLKGNASNAARKAYAEVLEFFKESFKMKSASLWRDYLTENLKASIREATLAPRIAEISKQENNARMLLDKLSVFEGSAEKLNLDSTETEQDVFSVLGISGAEGTAESSKPESTAETDHDVFSVLGISDK